MNNPLFEVSEISLSYKPLRSMIRNPPVITSRDAYDLLVKFYPVETVAAMEQFVVLFLNTANKVIGSYKLSSGGITGTVADTRIILSVALKCLAVGIVLSHNHPSGSLRPSNADRLLTSKIKDAAKLMDIKVLDHIILSPENTYFSFADEGLLQ